MENLYKSDQEREQAFYRDFKELLSKHNAKIYIPVLLNKGDGEIESDSEFGSEIGVALYSTYDAAHNKTAEFHSFNITV